MEILSVLSLSLSTRVTRSPWTAENTIPKSRVTRTHIHTPRKTSLLVLLLSRKGASTCAPGPAHSCDHHTLAISVYASTHRSAHVPHLAGGYRFPFLPLCGKRVPRAYICVFSRVTSGHPTCSMKRNAFWRPSRVLIPARERDSAVYTCPRGDPYSAFRLLYIFTHTRREFLAPAVMSRAASWLRLVSSDGDNVISERRWRCSVWNARDFGFILTLMKLYIYTCPRSFVSWLFHSWLDPIVSRSLFLVLAALRTTVKYDRLTPLLYVSVRVRA